MCGWSVEGERLKFDCGFKFVGTKRVARCSWSSDGHGSFQNAAGQGPGGIGVLSSKQQVNAIRNSSQESRKLANLRGLISVMLMRGNM
jgi:hypothetical protein